MFLISSVISGENAYGLSYEPRAASNEVKSLSRLETESSKRRDRKVAVSLFKLYGQANKRIWWMPRQLEAMKDVVVCDKLGGADKQALYPEISEWGNPAF